MPDLFNLTPQMQNYFDSLPKNVQQSIIMSGAKMNSLEDIKAVSNYLMGRTNESDES